MSADDDTHRELFAELAALRKKARRVCAEMRETVAEWRRIQEHGSSVRLFTGVLSGDLRAARTEANLGKLRSRRLLNGAGSPLIYASDPGPAAGDGLCAQNDNSGGPPDALGSSDTTLI